MTPTTTPSPSRAARSAPAGLSPEQVTALQRVRGAPCVSVLMSTTPAARTTPDDLVRLRSLIEDVRRRLAQEERPLDHEQLLERPEVIDDAVDELIEVVLRRGGWIALVDDGSLGESEGVALAVHHHD